MRLSVYQAFIGFLALLAFTVAAELMGPQARR